MKISKEHRQAMLYKNHLVFISNILIGIGILCNCSNVPEEKHQITFTALVKNPVEKQRVFLTGNRQELGNWRPDAIEMYKINDSLFAKTVALADGDFIHYKITAGNWWTEALDSNDLEYPELKLEVRKDTLLKVVVFNWKNTFYNGLVVLDKRRFLPKRPIMNIDNFWKYHSGDNPDWGREDFNDDTWKTVSSSLNWETDSSLHWQNTGWFRFHFIADTSLWNRSLAMLMDHLGSSELYYNGRYLNSFGGELNSGIQLQTQKNWKELRIAPKRKQIFAVKYVNYDFKKQRELGFSPGFVLHLKDINTTFQNIQVDLVNNIRHQLIFSLIPLILFFLHMLIFSFNPKQKEHLFYAISLLGFAGITYFNFEKIITVDPDLVILYTRMNGVSVPVAIYFGLLTSFKMQYRILPKRWMLYFIAFIFLVFFNYHQIGSWTVRLNYAFFGFIIIDIFLSSFIKKNKENLKGGWIVIAGLILLSFFIVLQILIDFSIIETAASNNQIFVYGMISFAVSMSVFLSFNFSQLHRNLEAQIIKVKTLSEKTIEQERKANRLEMERQRIESENNRKSHELEDARQLQLSLLPKQIPGSDNYDISFYMNPAAEVGGDYYDILPENPEQFTVAIGDATGHGVKAGIMVAIVKGLIHDMSAALLPVEILNRINRALMSMEMGNLYMGLTLLRVKKESVNISSAGMPAALLYRSSKQKIEELTIKRFPLGATNRVDFQEKKLALKEGDVLMLLSDGLPELFNSNGEMYEYDRIKNVLLKNIHKSASEIISVFKNEAIKWRKNFDQADDMTLVVIKFKKI